MPSTTDHPYLIRLLVVRSALGNVRIDLEHDNSMHTDRVRKFEILLQRLPWELFNSACLEPYTQSHWELVARLSPTAVAHRTTPQCLSPKFRRGSTPTVASLGRTPTERSGTFGRGRPSSITTSTLNLLTCSPQVMYPHRLVTLIPWQRALLTTAAHDSFHTVPAPTCMCSTEATLLAVWYRRG